MNCNVLIRCLCFLFSSLSRRERETAFNTRSIHHSSHRKWRCSSQNAKSDNTSLQCHWCENLAFTLCPSQPALIKDIHITRNKKSWQAADRSIQTSVVLRRPQPCIPCFLYRGLPSTLTRRGPGPVQTETPLLQPPFLLIPRIVGTKYHTTEISIWTLVVSWLAHTIW